VKTVSEIVREIASVHDKLPFHQSILFPSIPKHTAVTYPI